MLAGRQTLEVLSGAESIVDALELAAAEAERQRVRAKKKISEPGFSVTVYFLDCTDTACTKPPTASGCATRPYFNQGSVVQCSFDCLDIACTKPPSASGCALRIHLNQGSGLQASFLLLHAPSHRPPEGAPREVQLNTSGFSVTVCSFDYMQRDAERHRVAQPACCSRCKCNPD